MTTRDTMRLNAVLAAVLTLLRIAPIGVQALGGGGLPAPGSFNDPVRALATIGSSPALTIVAGIICATGVVQVFVVLALGERLSDREPRLAHLSVTFGVVAATFLMFDGALGIAALPQLARMDVHRDVVDAAYLATLALRNGIDRVIPLTLGIWALAAHWPVRPTHGLPMVLAVVGLVLGIVGVAGALFPAAGIGAVVLAAAWSAGFSMVLIRDSSTRAFPSSP